MQPTGGRADRLECVVVGGGLAGLRCAHWLARAGRSVHVLEAADDVGGRARTAWHEGRPVDLGFQALFSAYPETRSFLRDIGLSRRDLRPFARGAMVHDGVSWMRLGLLPGGGPGFARMSTADRARVVRLLAEVAARPPAALLAEGADLMTEDYLRERGFGPGTIERVFRPFFGVVLADRSLGADAGYFRFLLGMLARGPALLPADGLGMVAEWAAGAVRQTGGTVQTGVRVASLEPDAAGRRVQAVVLDDGRRVEPRYVVLAVDAPAARRLLAPLDAETAARLPDDPASSVTASFALGRPLYRGRTILLNAAPAGVEGAGPRVDLVCQTTNVTRPHQERGPHVVLATSVATGGPMPDPDDLQRAVGSLIRRWSPGFPWEREATLIGVHEHPFAQYRPWPGVRAALPGPRTRMDNLVLAGDLTRHPSIEGAVSSGAEAARIVDALA